jgi:nucleotide-binding universal stress UspA family protein
MFEKILLPLDGSEISELSLPYGEELARSLGSELILLHVHGQGHSQEYGHMHQMYLERLADTVNSHIRNDGPGGKEVKVTIKVEAGEPTENICNLVEKNDIDLVIMASVSASGLKIGKMLGSVTDHICRTVPAPVMLIRPRGSQKIESKKQLINQLLLPLDGSDLSKLALPVGEELALKLHVSITLFQMANRMRPYEDGSGNVAYFDYSQINEDVEKLVRAEMNVIEKELETKGLKVASVVTSGFDAAEDILETSKKVKADLVIMTTHGRSGLNRWVFGNVAEKVLRHGEMPVLLIHAKAS